MKNGNLSTPSLDYLLEGFQLIDFNWHYVYVNKSIVKQSKYQHKEELLGFTMMEKFPGIEETDMFKMLNFCMKERVSACFENEFAFPDNTVGYFELRVQPVPEGIFVLSIDITARKKAEQERKRFIKGLEEMIFMTSHKVRQPVSNIIGLSDLLEDDGLSQLDLKEICDFMKESALTLDEFTKELTSFIYELRKL